MIKSYKGYVPEIWYEQDDGSFHAIAQGIRSTIHCEAERLDDIQHEFEQSVDTYLEVCAEEGIEPQKPKSGKLAVRLAPEIHEMVSLAATADSKSVNQWIADTLTEAANNRIRDGALKISVK